MNYTKVPDRFVRLVSLVLLLSIVVAGQSPKQTQPAVHYKIIELPLIPVRVNNSGEVVGSARGRAAVWSREHGLRQLPVITGFDESESGDLNGAGHIVGSVMSADRAKSQAFIYQADKMLLLPGSGAKAHALNNSDVVVGESRVPGKKSTGPVFWMGETLTDLGACCGGTATGINNQGQVIGNMYDLQGRYRAFLWDQASGIRQIGKPNGDSSAVAISERGHVLVSEFDSGAFIYTGDGQLARLPLSSKSPSKVRGMNNVDTVVGSFGLFADVARAFIWDEKGGFRDLNELIPAGSGWTLESAMSINDRGEIVGVGDHNDEDDQGFLLIPE